MVRKAVDEPRVGLGLGFDSRSWQLLLHLVHLVLLLSSFEITPNQIARRHFEYERPKNYQVTRQFGCRNDGYDHFSGF